jgi:phage recombination protein Bet
MNAIVQARPSLLAKIAGKYNVDPDKMLATLKATAFKGNVSNEQMMALLIVADQYSLNPWTREIFAFPDKQNGVVPVVSVDGWSRILNDHPQFDGCEFVFGPEDDRGLPLWCDCTIYRKDRGHPVTVREYLIEVRRDTGPWKSHPRRMLRHKSLIQCARVALGFSGIYDQDEAERIAAGEAVIGDLPASASRTDQAKALLSRKTPAVEEIVLEEPPPPVDTETGELFDVEASRSADAEAARE